MHKSWEYNIVLEGQTYLAVCVPRVEVLFVVILGKPKKCRVVRTLLLGKTLHANYIDAGGGGKGGGVRL